MILSCNNIEKSFVTGTVLKNCSFFIEEREKAAIVGINGAGKSTLLKIIMGILPADAGTVTLSSGATIGYLAQQHDMNASGSIYDEVLHTRQDILDMEASIRSMEEDMNHLQGDELEALLNRYTRLTHDFELKNGYAYRSEVTGVLKGLGFEESDFNKAINSLSGGQKTRVALSKLLLSHPDIIMLDEPTNHLDISSVAWLETFLSNYDGSVIIVSHDRYFLDRIVTKVIEIDQSQVHVYSGNYSAYASKRALIRNAQMKAYLKQQQELEHQEAVITKLKSFNREKSIKRAESREKMLDKVERLEKPTEANASMNIRLEPRILSGNDVLQIEDLSKSFGSQNLFAGLSMDIKRGERVALIGDNGTGKTTILKIINDLIPADSGTIRLGSNVQIGYYDQEHHVLHNDKTIFDEISDDYPTLTNTQIRNVLAAFLFTNDDVFKYIRDLSGGELGRVSLAKLMLSESNFLILDEPTNHLDITSKEILEQALNNYTGTVLYVSHDRYFINTTATRILDLRDEKLTSYIGNYDYYIEKYNEKLEAAKAAAADISAASTEKPASSTEAKTDWKAQKEEQARLRKIQNALNRVEGEITRLEEENEALNEELCKPENATDVAKLTQIQKQLDANNDELETLYVQWEELQEE